jgi:hypothetical protein
MTDEGNRGTLSDDYEIGEGFNKFNIEDTDRFACIFLKKR